MLQPYAIIKDYLGEQKHTNAIAFCVDDKYLPYALFVALQIIEYEPATIDICVFLPDISKVPLYFLNKSIRFFEIEITGIDNLPTDHLSLSAYHRLFLPQLLNNIYQYVIYLDADVYIRRPFLSSLFEIIEKFDDNFAIATAPYMGEVAFLALPEKFHNPKIKQYVQTYHNLNHLYRNSGVIVFNIANCVSQCVQERVLNLAINNIGKLQSHDQSALNLVLLNSMPIIPLQFNWQLNSMSSTLISHFNPYILHFVNINKPWILRLPYLEPYYNEYREFLEKFFPDIPFTPETKLDKRRKEKKYNGIREKISLFFYSQKNTLEKTPKFKKYHNALLKAVDSVNLGQYKEL